MKHLKRIASLILAFAMIMSIAVSASAVKITIDDDTVIDAEYAAYKLLNATDLGGNKFAYSVNSKYKDVLIDVLNLDDDAADAEIIDAIEAERSDIQNFANDLYSKIRADKNLTADANAVENMFALNDQGYYLIVETKRGSVEGDPDVEDVYSLVMLDTAGLEDITVYTKEEWPTLDKIISNDDNNIEGDISADHKSDNVSVGSYVEFTLTTTVPRNAKYYSYYYFVIEDTLSEGLDFVNDEDHPLTVKSGNTLLAEDEDYALYTGDDADGTTFKVALLDAKGHAGETITVTYYATLNEKAVIGEEEGNINTADLIYSNDPNYEYGPNENNPGLPTDDEEIPMGETPDYVTRTYTTGIELIKVDQDHMPLTGAEFKIEGKNVVKVLVVEGTEFVEAENGGYHKLKDGTYTKQAPTEDRYEEITDSSRKQGYVKNNDGTYSVATEAQLKDHSIHLYKFVKGTKDYYSEDNKMYALMPYTYVMKESSDATYTAEVDDNGYLVIAGLGEGEYTITETKTPEGYNPITPFTVKIDWAPGTGNDCDWTATMNGETVEINEHGLFEIEVVNNSGTELPETGGMGTTLFYVIGGIMALAAVVLLVAKKRMASES